MFADVVTVIWKEWREILYGRGTPRTFIVSILIALAVWAIILPFPAETETQTEAWMQLWIVLPMIIILGLVPDSFAGERERHTLETLLASRLPDRAIVFGKMGVAVSYGWGCTLLASLMLLIKGNVVSNSEGLRFYSPVFFLSGLVGSLLVAIFVASVGILISLRSPTVRQAYLRVSLTIVAINLLLSIPLFFLLTSSYAFRVMTEVSYIRIALVALFPVALIDLALIALVLQQFKRSRLLE